MPLAAQMPHVAAAHPQSFHEKQATAPTQSSASAPLLPVSSSESPAASVSTSYSLVNGLLDVRPPSPPNRKSLQAPYPLPTLPQSNPRFSNGHVNGPANGLSSTHSVPRVLPSSSIVETRPSAIRTNSTPESQVAGPSVPKPRRSRSSERPTSSKDDDTIYEDHAAEVETLSDSPIPSSPGTTTSAPEIPVSSSPILARSTMSPLKLPGVHERRSNTVSISLPNTRTRGPLRVNSYDLSRVADLATVAKSSVEEESGSPADTHVTSPDHSHVNPPSEDAVFQQSIAQQAEQIRKEREAKRKDKIRRQEEQKSADSVLVGNLVGEDHVNYVLMYNMLTGIRVGVSRCQAKAPRTLTDKDYAAQHKFSFDIAGNELTPSAKYDFKFKDYAPWVFRALRDHFHLDPADYLLSLTSKYILSELGSPGKSGSFFYFSRDYRFIIKTIRYTEHKFLRSILKDYHDHVKQNPHTLISRFYGLHRVKLPHGRKIHFLIMNNLFPPHRDIHETFDLKGSSVGREYSEEMAAENPRAVLKDLNWIHRGRVLEFGPEKKALFEEQLRRDTEFLQRMGVIDYSLLTGIHDIKRGNKDNLRDGMLTMFQPDAPRPRRRPAVKRSREGDSDAMALRKAVQMSDPKALDESNRLPDKDTSERRHFIFYQDEGGFQATDDANQPVDTIYYFGVIDILTKWGFRKKVENLIKGFSYDRTRISPVAPDAYGQRFLNFLYSIVRGGNRSRRPKME